MAQNCKSILEIWLRIPVLLCDFYNLDFPFLGPKCGARGHEIFEILKKDKRTFQ